VENGKFKSRRELVAERFHSTIIVQNRYLCELSFTTFALQIYSRSRRRFSLYRITFESHSKSERRIKNRHVCLVLGGGKNSGKNVNSIKGKREILYPCERRLILCMSLSVNLIFVILLSDQIGTGFWFLWLSFVGAMSNLIFRKTILPRNAPS
jgi:hypothetical protein